MPLHAALGEATHACKSVLLSPGGNRSTQLHMQETARLLGEKCTFLAGSWADCPGDLHNFWAEQLTAAQICTNPGLNSLLLGKNCTNPAGRVGWQDCAILEPSRLSERIAQFLEGRLVSLQKCTIFKGKLLSLQLDQVRVSSL
jgi:hypothetical protein